MSKSTYDLEIYKGETYSLSLTLRDDNGVIIDLTNYNVSGFLKKNYSDTSKLSNLNASIASPATNGIVNLYIESTGTAVLPVGYLLYDLEIMNTGTLVVSKVLLGKVSVFPEVTF